MDAAQYLRKSRMEEGLDTEKCGSLHRKKQKKCAKGQGRACKKFMGNSKVVSAPLTGGADRRKLRHKQGRCG